MLNKFKIPKIILKKSINNKESVEIIKKYQPDLLISILGNQIFKKQIYDLAPKGCLNLHTALVTKVSRINAYILGVKETKSLLVFLFFM